MKDITTYGSFTAHVKELLSKDDIATSLQELKPLLENSPLLDWWQQRLVKVVAEYEQLVDL